jgi:acetyl-CoA carboxylase carboxyl transferase subunit alpha
MALAKIPVPVISVIIGEGCSGGALAMCATDYVGMLENSYLSVIAPEACASIIFRDPGRAAEAAEALKLTAADMKGRGIVDEIIPEPLGGAHNDPSTTIEAVGKALARYERYRRIGAHAAENGQNV